MPPNAWLHSKPPAGARLRLYCFPYAGGSAASFAAWQAALGPGIEVCAVQMPGRGNRFREPPETVMETLVEKLVQVIAWQPAGPFAFFGHSLGALVAYEVARALEGRALAAPQYLIVSGCAAPRQRGERRALHLLDDVELLASLERYNGTPAEVLANRELMEMLLPMIRADFALASEYTYRPAPPLCMPLMALAGQHDEGITGEQIAAWSRESVRPCPVTWFDGGHFFINERQDAVLQCIRHTLHGLIDPVLGPAAIRGATPEEAPRNVSLSN